MPARPYPPHPCSHGHALTHSRALALQAARRCGCTYCIGIGGEFRKISCLQPYSPIPNLKVSTCLLYPPLLQALSILAPRSKPHVSAIQGPLFVLVFSREGRPFPSPARADR